MPSDKTQNYCGSFYSFCILNYFVLIFNKFIKIL
nr:MAG TPA: Poxvirus A21 Protein [Caudoviricetes sp.]